MSLLMDALRRAEAEKKAAAKNKPAEDHTAPVDDNAPPSSNELLEEDEDLGATVKLDRLPLPMTGKVKQAGLGKPSTPTVTDITSSIEESLNDLSIDFESTSPRMRNEEILVTDSTAQNSDAKQDDTDNPKVEAQDETYDFSIHAQSQVNEEGQALTLEPIDDAEIIRTDSIPEPIPGTTSTLPSANKMDPPETNSVRGGIPSAQSAENTLAASDVDPLLIATPGESTLETTSGQTAVSANTVFEAGSPGISRRIILWTLTLGIALLALLTVTGLYYFQQAPTARPLPSPIASVELERARLKETLSENSEPSQKLAPVQEEITENTQIDPAADLILVEKRTEHTLDDVAQEIVNAEGNKLDTLSANALSRKDGSDDAQVEKDATSKINRPTASTQRNVPTIDTKRLSIARSMRGVRSNEHVLAAYEAYQAGDLGSAKALYEKAVAIRPQDINALNGLAALALGENDAEQAHQLYSKVLKLEPNNPTATAALFQIEGGVGSRVTETQLKMMLDNDGDPGLINFALGNLYSRHKRWNDAQLAFFEAVRHRPNNPDYLFNLAVSLDQIGQRKAAKEFYEKAVTAADESSAGFNVADAIARIQSITQSASASAP